jgi:UDP-3-O-[3-hydroxymyristoyl] glucosamine N-acyltransferase
VPRTVAQLAEQAGAEYHGRGDVVIESAAPIETAQVGQISFLSNPVYKKYLATTKASALVLAPGLEAAQCSVIIGPNPYLLFSKIINILYPPPYERRWEIHPTAVVAASAHLPHHVYLGPRVVVEDEVSIGENTVIEAGAFIGKNTTIGSACQIGPNASILYGSKIGNNVFIYAGTVIGSDGFGFAPTEPGQEFKKIRQVGWVEVENNVEIGANVTIDRGALGPTVIESGVKIDNLVMIAHNVRIGANSIIVAQTGISGSTKLGRSVILAGQVGVTGHIEIGDGAMVGAQAGVSKSLDGGQSYTGYPARRFMEQRRIDAALSQLPELLKRVTELERRTERKE